MPHPGQTHERQRFWYERRAPAQAVDLLYNAAGGSALYEDNLLERCFRNVHATTQHVGLASLKFELSGRVPLGLDSGTPRL